MDLTFRERVDAFYEALWREHVTVDFVHPSADISGYRVVVAPSSYLLTEASAKNLHRYVEAGGNLLVSYFSGIVDEYDTIHPGAHPGALRELLGLSIEEFHPLREHETVALTGGGPSPARARVWSERIRPAGAVAVRDFAEGPDAGHPAFTRHDLGAGTAWYLATAPVTGLRDLLAQVLDRAEVSRPRGLPDTLELVRRGAHVFLINHGDRPVTVEGVSGVSVFDGARHDGPVTVEAGAVTVVVETPNPRETR